MAYHPVASYIVADSDCSCCKAPFWRLEYSMDLRMLGCGFGDVVLDVHQRDRPSVTGWCTETVFNSHGDKIALFRQNPEAILKFIDTAHVYHPLCIHTSALADTRPRIDFRCTIQLRLLDSRSSRQSSSRTSGWILARSPSAVKRYLVVVRLSHFVLSRTSYFTRTDLCKLSASKAWM